VLLVADIWTGLGGLEGGQYWHLQPSGRVPSEGCEGVPVEEFDWRLGCGIGGVLGLLGGIGGCIGGGVVVMVRGRSYQQDSPPPGGAGVAVTNRGTEYSEFPLLPPLPCDDKDMRSQLVLAWGWWQ
jgi:hypothetical protein